MKQDLYFKSIDPCESCAWDISYCFGGDEHDLVPEGMGRWPGQQDYCSLWECARCKVGVIYDPADRLAVVRTLVQAVKQETKRTCVGCEQRGVLQLDHVRPRHAGGRADHLINLVPLCETCNRVKSCYWPGHGYHPFPDANYPTRAADVLDKELAWLEARHGRAKVERYIWGEDGEPGSWAFRRLPGGMPKWLDDWRPRI